MHARTRRVPLLRKTLLRGAKIVKVYFQTTHSTSWMQGLRRKEPSSESIFLALRQRRAGVGSGRVFLQDLVYLLQRLRVLVEYL